MFCGPTRKVTTVACTLLSMSRVWVKLKFQILMQQRNSVVKFNRSAALVVLIIMLNTCTCYSQSGWGVRLDVGLENSDSRLFNTPDSQLFEDQPAFLNAQVFYLGVNRALRVANQVTIIPSLGIKITRQFFDRPFAHSLVRTSDNTRILRFYSESESFGISPSAQVEYSLKSKLSFVIRSELFVPFRRSFKNEGNSDFPYVSNDLSVESFEVSPGIKLRYAKVHLGLSVRALRIAALDDIIFGPWIRDEEFRMKTVDFHNPLRIVLTADYWL